VTIIQQVGHTASFCWMDSSTY